MKAKDCLKKVRLEMCVTQREFAKLLSISYGTYTHYESGSRNMGLNVIRSTVDILQQKGIKITYKDLQN